ncbi:hypothetical protein AcV7_008629 [Taiwanofungus camphoratus]|nr:hypothetical protein AcV7_008629 [Antrodia cinnamomea]
MTEVDTFQFGAPNSLLSGPSTSDCIVTRITEGDHFTALHDLATEEAITTGGLLSGDQSKTVGLHFTEMPHDSSHDLFVPTGLLSIEANDATNISKRAQSPGTFTDEFAISQMQGDEEFPDVTALLQPYTHATTSAGMASSSAILPSSILRTTTFDGRTVFLRRKLRREEGRTSVASNRPSAGGTSPNQFSKLLDVPIHRLLDQLSAAAVVKLADENVNASSSAQSPSTTNSDGALWVDRYRPRRFTDLLGDDRVHREVMAWVKEWDHCVFGRHKARGRKRGRGEDDENTDEFRRPQERILLMSGPPGMGKTTLAHVVAQHAGYSVFEINASDARSTQSVQDVIRPALETGFTIGSTKPILMVIDEIDGATGGTDNTAGFIQALIKLLSERPRKKGRKVDPKSSRPIRRPIICICNDLYANSLAKLRPLARVVRFSRPNDIHLVRRLRDICENEGLRTESRALTTLVGVAQGDLRGCLNMLQLIKARGRDVTESVVRTATAGMKEVDMSQTAVLNDLFAPMTRKRAKDLGLNEDAEARYVGRLSREIEGSGAMDRIALGCFEHYASLHQHDANFSRYLKANEWLTMFDIMSGEMYSEREYALMQYLPYPLVAFYPLFQERGTPRVERPKADWENHVRTKVNEEIYKSLARCLRVAAARHGGDFRHLASDQILQLEFASFINRIISPPLRPVNSQVIRPGERAVLSRLVNIMVALELRFVQEKAEDGQLVYRLDPPIDVFVTYDGKRASDIAASRYAVRHLVAAEIDAQFVSRQTEGLEKTKPIRSNFFSKASREDGDLVGTEDDDRLRDVEPELVKSKRARQDKTVTAEKVATDFFGRPIVPKTGDTTQSAMNTKKAQIYRIKFKFNEGNSAAVRKPVKVGAFL